MMDYVKLVFIRIKLLSWETGNGNQVWSRLASTLPISVHRETFLFNYSIMLKTRRHLNQPILNHNYKESTVLGSVS